MNTATRLSLYGVGLVGTFVVAYFLAGALVPEHVVEAWMSGVRK